MAPKQCPKSELYNQLYKSVREPYSEKTLEVINQKAKDIWARTKAECNNDLIQMKQSLAIKIKELNAENCKRKGGLLQFFANAAQKPRQNMQEKGESSEAGKMVDSGAHSSGTEKKANYEEAATSTKFLYARSTPAQEKVNMEIDKMTKKIEAYNHMLSSGIGEEREETKRTIKSLKEEREKALKRKINLDKDAERKRNSRAAKKKKVEELIERRPEIAEELVCLTTREKVGRPEYSHNEELLKAIQEIAIHGCGADDRRRSEIIRSVRSLDDLTDEVTKMGFTLSRQALYLRLLPKRHNSSEGKRHVTTAPVKLCRASNDQRSKNPDRWFGANCMEQAEELASLFGPSLTSFSGQDDKSHVPIGITAANKQAPLLMSVKYKVSLPDHDFIVATKHKLTPTVIGLRVIQDTPIADRKACK